MYKFIVFLICILIFQTSVSADTISDVQATNQMIENEMSEIEIEILEIMDKTKLNEQDITTLESELNLCFTQYNQTIANLQEQILLFDNQSNFNSSTFIELENLYETIKENNEILLTLKAEKESLTSFKSELETKYAQLSDSYTENELYIYNLNSNNTEILAVADIETVLFEEDLYNSLNFAWPIPGYGVNYITCLFGNGHNGLDVAANYGEAVIASESGTVISSEYHYSWGNNVLISHNDEYKTRYAHLSAFNVEVGDTVEQGDIIGYIGSTGNSTGNHLHFEIYYNGVRVDPLLFL